MAQNRLGTEPSQHYIIVNRARDLSLKSSDFDQAYWVGWLVEAHKHRNSIFPLFTHDWSLCLHSTNDFGGDSVGLQPLPTPYNPTLPLISKDEDVGNEIWLQFPRGRILLIFPLDMFGRLDSWIIRNKPSRKLTFVQCLLNIRWIVLVSAYLRLLNCIDKPSASQ